MATMLKNRIRYKNVKLNVLLKNFIWFVFYLKMGRGLLLSERPRKFWVTVTSVWHHQTCTGGVSVAYYYKTAGSRYMLHGG